MIQPNLPKFITLLNDNLFFWCRLCVEIDNLHSVNKSEPKSVKSSTAGNVDEFKVTFSFQHHSEKDED